jgi:hypothetical protein
MAKLTKEQRVVRQIIKEHGERLNLRTDPHTFLEIVRKYALDLSGLVASPDGGLPPGGVGPVGPTSRQLGPSIDDVMKEVLKLQRQVARLSKKRTR